MILGAIAVSLGEASALEQASWKMAMERECARYGLDSGQIEASLQGEDTLSRGKSSRSAWEILVIAAAVGLFVWLGLQARKQAIAMNAAWMGLLIAASLVLLVAAGVLLWRRTRFA
jgi:NhaP-type Na+/H+ or K+/H+ antiporter